jgi:hypothetical protein
MTEHGPALLVAGTDVLEILDSLAKDRRHSGRALGSGDLPKLFGLHPCKWNSGTLQPSYEFSGKWVYEKLFAVEQRVHRKTMIDCFHEVAHAFDKEQLGAVTVTALVL